MYLYIYIYIYIYPRAASARQASRRTTQEALHRSRLGAMYMEGRSRPTFSQIRALTFLIITLSILVALLVNPIYVFVFVPLIAWLFISDRPGAGRPARSAASCPRCPPSRG